MALHCDTVFRQSRTPQQTSAAAAASPPPAASAQARDRARRVSIRAGHIRRPGVPHSRWAVHGRVQKIVRYYLLLMLGYIKLKIR